VFQGLAAQRLLALFFAGALLLNFPLLALFVVWAVLIGLTAWIVERGEDVE